MQSIPPIPPIPPPAPSDEPAGGLAQQLQYLIAELRGEMGANPPNTQQITATVEQLQSFLNTNHNAILAQCQAEGYPFSGGYNPLNEISAAQNLCTEFLSDPTNLTPLFLMNESITQLHYEMTNPYSS